MSLLEILHEDRYHWLSVHDSSKNRLVQRTALRNIAKRNGQIRQISRIQRENNINHD